MRLVEVNGAVVRVRDTGPNSSARTVVLVPDPPNVIEHYDRLIAALEKNYRVVCFDLPGFGFSVPPPGFRFSGDEYADIAVGLFHQLEVEAPLWAASCAPAYVGLHVAARHPGVVSGLVCGQAPSWEEELRWTKRLDRPRLLSRPVLGQLFMRVAARRLATGWYETAALPEQREWMASIGLDSLRRGASYSLASSFQAILSTSELPVPVDVPSIFVWGVRDRTHRKTDPDSVRENARDPRIVEFEGSAHFPDLEEPERFTKLVDELARQ